MSGPRLEPAELATLGMSVDAGIALGQHGLGATVAVHVGDGYHGGHVPGREVVRLPYVWRADVAEPARPGDDLIPPIAVNVRYAEPLFWQAILDQPIGDTLHVGPWTDRRILGNRRPEERGAPLVAEHNRYAPVSGDVPDGNVMELLARRTEQNPALPPAAAVPGIAPPRHFVGAPVAAREDIGQAVAVEIEGHPAAFDARNLTDLLTRPGLARLARIAEPGHEPVSARDEHVGPTVRVQIGHADQRVHAARCRVVQFTDDYSLVCWDRHGAGASLVGLTFIDSR